MTAGTVKRCDVATGACDLVEDGLTLPGASPSTCGASDRCWTAELYVRDLNNGWICDDEHLLALGAASDIDARNVYCDGHRGVR